MSKITRIDNVPIQSLIQLLTGLSGKYEFIDIIVYPEEKKVVIEPVEMAGEELTDENIYDII